MSNRPDIIEAYRVATGVEYQEACRKAREKVSSLPKVNRVIISVIGSVGFGPTHPEDRQRWGWKRLRDLLNTESGIYPRGGIAYEIDGYGSNAFIYDLIFLGSSIGESGKIQFENYRSKVWLRKGDEKLIEIAEKGESILHLVEYEGIAVRFVSHCSSPVGVSYGGGISYLATWYPDLSDSPQLFSGLERGRTEWNNSSQKRLG